MQEETEDLENVYKELLLLFNEFKVIKKNEVHSVFEEGWEKNPTNGRSKSDTSAMSYDMDMMMDAPDDVDEDEQGKGHADVFDNESAGLGRMDTLESARSGSMTSQEFRPSNFDPK